MNAVPVNAVPVNAVPVNAHGGRVGGTSPSAGSTGTSGTEIVRGSPVTETEEDPLRYSSQKRSSEGPSSPSARRPNSISPSRSGGSRW